MDWISNPDIWLSLLTLTALEIVLGIDNIIFIAILAGKLPPERQAFARNVGLGLALVTRLGLLFTLSWLAGLTAPLFSVFGEGVSWRDIVLIGGGLFLMWARPCSRSTTRSRRRQATMRRAGRRRVSRAWCFRSR